MGIKPGTTFRVSLGNIQVDVPWVGTYGDVNLMEPLALVSHNEELKLSINQGDFATEMKVNRGGAVVVSR